MAKPVTFNGESTTFNGETGTFNGQPGNSGSNPGLTRRTPDFPAKACLRNWVWGADPRRLSAN